MQGVKSTPGRKKTRVGRLNLDINRILEPVDVFCRLKPLPLPEEKSCITVTSPEVIQLSPPDMSKNSKILQCNFHHVFTEHSPQKDIFDEVAVPMVENLIAGKSGLIFCYGVTGSGKTYTMTGKKKDPGLIPRCLHALFNSVSGQLVPRFQIKPNNMNGYEANNMSDAEVDLHHNFDFNEQFKTSGSAIRRDSQFAIFVQYVEIYNNVVYDLLDPSPNDKPPLKILREDWKHNTYVNDVCEMEVQTADEAFDMFVIGESHRKRAQTRLNSASTRGHAIFTIRVVRGTISPNEEYLSKGQSLWCSQLSLVDLAGSERNSRTQTSGHQLREASCINNTLMTLRTCLEILRYNQQQGENKHIPYRDSRLTHLFKNYFEGKGSIKMVVCINPSSTDYDENIQVLKFAEMTREIKLARIDSNEVIRKSNEESSKKGILKKISSDKPTDVKLSSKRPETKKRLPFAGQLKTPRCEIGHSVKKRKSKGSPKSTKYRNKDLKNKEVITREKELSEAQVLHLKERNLRAGYIGTPKECIKTNELKSAPYSNKLSSLKKLKKVVSTPDPSSKFRKSLQKSLEQKLSTLPLSFSNLPDKENISSYLLYVKSIAKRSQKRKLRLLEKREAIRKRLLTMQQDYLSAKCEGATLRKLLSEKREEYNKEQQSKLGKEILYQKMKSQLSEKDTRILDLMQQLKESNFRLNQNILLKETEKKKIQEEMTNKFDAQIKSERKKLKTVMQEDQRKLKLVTGILTKPGYTLPFKGSLEPTNEPGPSGITPRKAAPVANVRYRRSKSTGDMWLEHLPATPVPLGTVLQPSIRRKKSVSKLTDIKDVTASKQSKYLLVDQIANEKGNLQTNFYKGDIIPTCSGGAQVIFDDVEKLQQEAPAGGPIFQPLVSLKRKCTDKRNKYQ